MNYARDETVLHTLGLVQRASDIWMYNRSPAVENMKAPMPAISEPSTGNLAKRSCALGSKQIRPDRKAQGGLSEMCAYDFLHSPTAYEDVFNDNEVAHRNR